MKILGTSRTDIVFKKMSSADFKVAIIQLVQNKDTVKKTRLINADGFSLYGKMKAIETIRLLAIQKGHENI